MANISKTILDNARALELFIRISPEATYFLDDFGAAHMPQTQIALRCFPENTTKEERAAAKICADHIKRLFPAKSSLQYNENDSESLDMGCVFDLSNPRLKKIILDATAKCINERVKIDSAYTLSYLDDDPAELQQLLKQPLPQPVTIEYLEQNILPEMKKLTTILAGPRRYQSNLGMM